MIEYLINRSRNYSSLPIIILNLIYIVFLFGLVTWPEHRMRFTRASLSIGEDGDIISFHNFRYEVWYFFVDISLGRLLAKGMIELDLVLRILICCHSYTPILYYIDSLHHSILRLLSLYHFKCLLTVLLEQTP